MSRPRGPLSSRPSTGSVPVTWGHHFSSVFVGPSVSWGITYGTLAARGVCVLTPVSVPTSPSVAETLGGGGLLPRTPPRDRIEDVYRRVKVILPTRYEDTRPRHRLCLPSLDSERAHDGFVHRSRPSGAPVPGPSGRDTDSHTPKQGRDVEVRDGGRSVRRGEDTKTGWRVE